jgi:hypothetical protein
MRKPWTTGSCRAKLKKIKGNVSWTEVEIQIFISKSLLFARTIGETRLMKMGKPVLGGVEA